MHSDSVTFLNVTVPLRVIFPRVTPIGVPGGTGASNFRVATSNWSRSWACPSPCRSKSTIDVATTDFIPNLDTPAPLDVPYFSRRRRHYPEIDRYSVAIRTY